MAQTIANRRSVNMVSIEDPIEFVHSQGRSLVNQREVGSDVHSFASALKNALRQDADVILVGELRDLDTIQTAITAAETGHLVIGTMHTNDAPTAIGRIIDAVQKRVSSSSVPNLRGRCWEWCVSISCREAASQAWFWPRNY
jgi:Tfp pilus assembly protein, pilus retraction ATPase PilT